MDKEKLEKKLQENARYWQTRYSELESVTHRESVEFSQNLEKQFEEAFRNIDRQLERFYKKFAREENITITEARRLLNSDELDEFHMSVEEYVRLGEKNGKLYSARINKKLERASLKYRVTRLEAIGLQVMVEACKAFDGTDEDFWEFLSEVYISRYYRSVFTIFEGFGIGTSLSTINSKELELLLSKPWADDGKHFSDRIWSNRTKLTDDLYKTLTQAFIEGNSYTETSERLQKVLRTSYNKCARLVVTESAYISSIAQLECWEELGVEQYQIIATLDTVTSEICQEMDGNIYLLSEFTIGETAPPFHPNCRTTTCPYFNDSDLPGYIEGSRSARNQPDGESYLVPANMKYKGWFQKYILKKKSSK